MVTQHFVKPPHNPHVNPSIVLSTIPTLAAGTVIRSKNPPALAKPRVAPCRADDFVVQWLQPELHVGTGRQRRKGIMRRLFPSVTLLLGWSGLGLSCLRARSPRLHERTCQSEPWILLPACSLHPTGCCSSSARSSSSASKPRANMRRSGESGRVYHECAADLPADHPVRALVGIGRALTIPSPRNRGVAPWP